jgi:hypothetical protein
VLYSLSQNINALIFDNDWCKIAGPPADTSMFPLRRLKLISGVTFYQAGLKEWVSHDSLKS